jgi:5-methylcytosine-specific restriction endonuclease McrA
MRLQALSYLAVAGLVAAAVSLPLGGTASAAACNDMWKPVCGKVGGFERTYSNKCWAKMNKAVILHNGVCKWK